MRILLGHTADGLHPDTVAALRGVELDAVDVSGDDFAYWNAVKERWDGTDDLVIIEQDNVIHDTVFTQFAECPGDWCVFPYPIFNSGQRLTQGLGCTRFSAALQRRVPAAEFEAGGKLHHGHTGGIPWNFLDIVIADRLRLGHGLVPHVHEPDVAHLHDYTAVPQLGVPPENGERPPASPYDRELPVLFGPAEVFAKPAVMVYGAQMTPVGSLEDAARLANSLAARYLEDGRPLEVPAQLDTSRPPALRFASDKVTQGYLPAYLDIAAKIGTSGRACEIGVWQGESLRMWQALFPGGIAAGADVDPGARWPQEAVRIVAAQDDPELPARLAAVSPEGWDLIVDDASHDGKLTRATWELLWPLVVPGGWYVVEDWFVGFGKHPMFPGDCTMLATAESFLGLLDQPGGEVETVTYRYGMIILRKATR